MERMIELFTDGKGKQMKEKNLLIGKLTKEIGQLKVELGWLKKAGFTSRGKELCSSNEIIGRYR